MAGGMGLFADGVLKQNTRQLQIYLTVGGRAYQQLSCFLGKGHRKYSTGNTDTRKFHFFTCVTVSPEQTLNTDGNPVLII